MRTTVILFVLLAGCTTHYLHPSKNSADFELDLHECERDFAAIQDRIIADSRIDRCLRMKGWRPE